MQIDCWQFSRNADLRILPWKLPNIHLHAWLFSNPCEKVFFILKSMGQICPLDLTLLKTCPHGLENTHAWKWFSDHCPGIVQICKHSWKILRSPFACMVVLEFMWKVPNHCWNFMESGSESAIYCSIPGKLSEIHLHVWFFSNP